MLPSVSVPSDTAAKFADTAAPEPELEPQGLRSMPYGLCVWPPRPDQPLIDSKERKFAHSDRLVLPRMTAPPARSLAATVESRSAGAPAERERAGRGLHPVAGVDVVLEQHRDAVQRPQHAAATARDSAARAWARASGLSSMTAFTPGPPWSMARMRARYARVRSSELSRPVASSCWSCFRVASRRGKGGADSAAARELASPTSSAVCNHRAIMACLP